MLAVVELALALALALAFYAVIPAQAGIAPAFALVSRNSKSNGQSDSRLRGNDGIRATAKAAAKTNANPESPSC